MIGAQRGASGSHNVIVSSQANVREAIWHPHPLDSLIEPYIWHPILRFRTELQRSLVILSLKTEVYAAENLGEIWEGQTHEGRIRANRKPWIQPTDDSICPSLDIRIGLRKSSIAQDNGTYMDNLFGAVDVVWKTSWVCMLAQTQHTHSACFPELKCIHQNLMILFTLVMTWWHMIDVLSERCWDAHMVVQDLFVCCLKGYAQGYHYHCLQQTSVRFCSSSAPIIVRTLHQTLKWTCEKLFWILPENCPPPLMNTSLANFRNPIEHDTYLCCSSAEIYILLIIMIVS